VPDSALGPEAWHGQPPSPTTPSVAVVQPVAIDPEDGRWEIERLLDDIHVRVTYRWKNRFKHFCLAKWMGFDFDKCSWQEAEHIDKEVIKGYESAVAKGDITRGVWKS
jgi:hypothetical protein